MRHLDLRAVPRDPSARADVVARRPLWHVAGACADLDRAPHVRAGSALVAAPDGLWIVQDDARFLARVAPDGAVHAVPLPRGPDGLRQHDERRGTKHLKLDLEAGFFLPGPPARLVALGSGSTSAREQVVDVVLSHVPVPRVVPAGPLYAALRGCLGDAELNVEGAAVEGGILRVLQRGNGAGGVDALLEVPLDEALAALDGGPLPRLLGGSRLELGALGGVRLTPTDLLVEGGTTWLCAAAEASPDAVRDGEVVGAAVGWLDAGGGGWAPLEQDGAPVRAKVEGIARGAQPDELLLVTDEDDPDAPAELLVVRVRRAGRPSAVAPR